MSRFVAADVAVEPAMLSFGWITDGDLGHYNAVEVRLPAADTLNCFISAALVYPTVPTRNT